MKLRELCWIGVGEVQPYQDQAHRWEGCREARNLDRNSFFQSDRMQVK